MIRVAINGFGRIGRLAFREMIMSTVFDVVAINDLSNAEELAYLLKYDTNHRCFHEDEISFDGDYLVIGGVKKIRIFSCKDALELPWGDLDIDVVLECTGRYTAYDDAHKHIEAGAKKVLISAPGKGDMKTIVFNVNHETLDGSEEVVSAASCTTNCLAPVLNVIENNFGVKKGFMTTIHAYTNDQATLDIAHSKGIYARRGRACAQNIVPASTGAASAIGKVLPNLAGKLDGVAFRVPVPCGSCVDLTLELNKNTTVEEINKVLEDNKNNTLMVTHDPIVSSDVLGKKCGSLVDLLSTQVLDSPEGQLVKIVSWYDNEMGYTHQMVQTLEYMMNSSK